MYICTNSPIEDELTRMLLIYISTLKVSFSFKEALHTISENNFHSPVYLMRYGKSIRVDLSCVSECTRFRKFNYFILYKGEISLRKIIP